jgi:hypothetical protein
MESSSRPWASDFSYAYLRRLLMLAHERFEVRPVSEASPADAVTAPVLLLRHDVDVSLDAARPVAALEADIGLRATYMLMTTSPLYEVEDEVCRRHIRGLVDAGHEIGLHFDAHDSEARQTSAEALNVQITAARQRLEVAAGAPVRSVSFHRPQPEVLRGPRLIADCVNAYSAELMAAYLSDSRGSWRDGEPIARLERANVPLLQVLIHPIWWGDEHREAEDRLEEFFARSTAGSSTEDRDRFDRDLLASLPGVRRRGLSVEG